MRNLILVFTLLISFNLFAQDIEALDIGDKMPDVEFNLLSVNGKETKARFSDYKGKFVIFDFWYTTCGPCLKAMPKMDSLQKKYKDNLKVILVNSSGLSDTKVKVIKFLEKWKQKFPSFALQTVFEDTQLKELFPFAGAPHYVMVDNNGIVQAIPLSKQLTEQNIRKFLSGETLQLTKRVDFKNNLFLPLGNHEDVSIGEFESVRIFKKGRIPDLGGLNKQRAINGKVRGYAFRNISLMNIYRSTLRGLKQELSVPNRFLILSKRPMDLDRKATKMTLEERSHWLEQNLYTYDVVVPQSEILNDSLTLYKQMLQDLNQFSPFVASIERRKMKCLVLVRTSKEDKIKAKDAKSRMQLSFLVNRFNNNENIKMPVIDETGYTDKVDLEFSKFPKDFNGLRMELQKYDLDLIEAEREIEMFVIRDKIIGK